ncbi:MAG: hypothetical protein HRT44_11850, partial [Bdellovibrionales bacterium]|nr:hypothetical protein [Bdellovibrionales bacterium]NQZ19933.1 hypothetical protein [Bdellovibrionales bacterium]
MRLLSLLAILVSFNISVAQDGNKIKKMSTNINQRLQAFQNYSKLTNDERRSIRAELRYLGELLDDLGIGGTTPLFEYACAKQNNGRFYPVDKNTFEIIGSTSHNASYPDQQSCKETLPESDDV